MVTHNVPANSILTMPLAETKFAPEKFSGRYNKIKPFLIHYELLLEQNNVLSDKDKCELVSRYCSRKVTEFIQALPTYSEKKWDKLKEDLLKYYDADLDNKKYRTRDLVKMVKECKEKKLKNLSAWREYGRKFITIGGWLLKRNKISEDEYATYYWNGIPKPLRTKVENRLLAKDPVRSLASPFKVDEINGAVEALLQRDRFDMNFAGSDEEDSDDDEEDSESDDEDEEDDLKILRRRIRKKAKYSKKKKSDTDDTDDSDEEEFRTIKQKATKEPRRKINGKDEPEIEKLIKQLNSMSIEDPGYAALVFRALKIDPEVMQVIRPPVFASKPIIPNSPQFPRNTQSFRPQNPPHISPRFPPPRPFAKAPEDGMCYACNASGHRMTVCPELQDLMAKKIVMRNGVGRYVFGDGRPIRRQQGDSMIQAIHSDDFYKQNQKLESHLIRVVYPENEELTSDIYYGNLDSDTSESDSNDEYSDENYGAQMLSAAIMEQSDGEYNEARFTYPVTRTDRTMSAKRREAMEAEYQQPKERKQAKGKREDVKEVTTNKRGPPKRIERPVAPIINQVPGKPAQNEMHAENRMQVPVPIVDLRKEGGERKPQGYNKNVEQTRGPVPVEVKRPEYNGRKDDEIMEDIQDLPKIQARRHDARETKDSIKKLRPGEALPAHHHAPEKEKYTRQSEISAHVKTVEVLNQVLNTRMDLAIGEVLGISKDLSALLTDKIKPKSTKLSVPISASVAAPISASSSAPVATSLFTKNRGLLIQLHMQCDGRPITAIIDTGSQLNIINKAVCDLKIRRPVDNLEKISIADANGGQGKLEGMVADVPLNCGQVATTANLYVGTHVPFELLLGRPWQRGNYVTIDERRDGTYLLFKDPKNLEARFEILVARDRIASEIQYELPVWNLPEAPNNPFAYHISINDGPEILAEELTGPTMQPNSSHLPFSVSELKSTIHAPQPMEFNRLYPQTEQWKLSTSITDKEGAGLNLRKGLISNSTENIKSMNKQDEKLPKCEPGPAQSMPTVLQFRPTEAQQGTAITPLGGQGLFRIDSEVLTTAIADLPFLRRSKNTHPLLLSSSDGVLLGYAKDPSGYTHSDYLFLNAGLIHPASSPVGVTPAAAFVRLFPELNTNPPQPWLLPYINEPPTSVMVSLSGTNQANSSTNKFEFGLQQFSAGQKQVEDTSKLPVIKEETEPVAGKTGQEFSKSLDPTLKSPKPQQPTPQELSKLIQSPARVFGNNSIDTTFFSNNLSTHTSDTAKHKTISRIPTPALTADGSAEDTSSNSSTCGSSADADGEADMEVEVDDDADAAMEWENINKDIQEELAEEREREARAEVIASRLRRDKERREELNKENIKTKTPPKVDQEVLNRLYASYTELAGEPPSEEAVYQLQQAYMNYKVKLFPPALYNDSNMPFKVNPPPPFVPATARLPSINIQSLAPTPPPSRVENEPNFPPTLMRAKYAPRISSPLATMKPITFIPPDPPMVYSVQTMPTNDEHVPPLELSSPVAIIKTEDELSKHTMDQDTETSTPNTATATDNSTDTVPTSPVTQGAATKLGEHIERFRKSRIVKKDELLAGLKIEADLLRKDIAAAEDCKCGPDTECDHKDEEKRCYSDRLTETIARIEKLEVEQVGEIDVIKMFLAGLMHIIRLTDILSTPPLPFSDPPLIPSIIPGSASEALNNDISRKTDRYKSEPAMVTYDQAEDSLIPQCPNQPQQYYDPRKIPIGSRPYFQGGANDYNRQIAKIRANILVDLRSLTIVENGAHVPASFLREFTELAGTLEPYIFPGRLAPTYEWPLNVPRSNAITFRDRIVELREARREVERIYQETSRSLTRPQLAESLTPYITLHKRISPNSLQLTPIKMDRIYFWQRIHPVWNPLLKPVEATFLRGAIYVFYGEGKTEKAEGLERLLRTPHYDDWEVRELVSLGALDNEFREPEALEYFKEIDDEHWGYHASEQAFQKSANDILESMEEDDLYSPAHDPISHEI